MSQIMNGSGCTMTLSSLAQLDEQNIEQLRTHALRGGWIQLGFESLPASRSLRSSIAMTTAARDCGYEAAGAAAAGALLAGFGTNLAATGDVVPGNLGVGAAIAGTIVAATVIGKVLGARRARRRLLNELRRLRAEMATSAR